MNDGNNTATVHSLGNFGVPKISPAGSLTSLPVNLAQLMRLGSGYPGDLSYQNQALPNQSQGYPAAPNQNYNYQAYPSRPSYRPYGYHHGYHSYGGSWIAGITIILVWAALIMSILGLARWTFGRR